VEKDMQGFRVGLKENKLGIRGSDTHSLMFTDVKVPKENIPVNEAYNFFNQWATSGGSEFTDWYKDNPRYRDPDKLEY